MKKLTTLAVLATVLMAAPVFADDSAVGVASDVSAVQKDNMAIVKNKTELAKHRAAKARAKASGDLTSQATESVKIGADKMTGSEKASEKDADQKVLNTDVNSAVSK